MNNNPKKILYGIQCTGNGHFSRSTEIIKELRQKGFEVDILVSGESYQKDFGVEIKYRYKGLSFDPNKGLTVIEVLKKNSIIEFAKDILHAHFDEYDLIITDFEPITSWAALVHGNKILGVGNHYKIFEWTWKFELFFFLNKLACLLISPVRHHVGFDYLRSNKKIFNPIIRDDIKHSTSFDSGNYVVYLHNYTWEEQVEFYKKFPQNRFIIYSNAIKESLEVGNSIIKPLDNQTFKNDLIASKGVVCNAGFQTTSECLYLGKKVFVIPMKNQIEQKYNKNVLKNLGFYWDNSLKEKSFEMFLNSNYFLKINYTNSIDKIMKKVNSMIYD